MADATITISPAAGSAGQFPPRLVQPASFIRGCIYTQTIGGQWWMMQIGWQWRRWLKQSFTTGWLVQPVDQILHAMWLVQPVDPKTKHTTHASKLAGSAGRSCNRSCNGGGGCVCFVSLIRRSNLYYQRVFTCSAVSAGCRRSGRDGRWLLNGAQLGECLCQFGDILVIFPELAANLPAGVQFAVG